jgi:hypothetical protein
MVTKVAELRPIQMVPGVQPSTDRTAFATEHFTYSKGIRFENGYPKKIGGNQQVDFNLDATIDGTARSLYGTYIDGRLQTVIGTNTKLYSVYGTTLTNITPLDTATIAIANSLDTYYGTLAANPLATVDGSNTITVTDATIATRGRAGDLVTLSGAAATNGIPAIEINVQHIIRAVDSGAGTFDIATATSATSTGTGGGGAVVRASGMINVAAAAHGMSEGDRVKINGAANTGGILAANINLEFIIRNVAAGDFDVVTAGTATSSVSSAGGAATTYQKEIADGALDETFGQGYGVGLYGVGLYGTAGTAISGRQYPRIWFIDRFGDDIVMTPGNQTGVYSWGASTATAPALISGAPTAVNYIFQSDNILVTFGAGGDENRIYASDQGDFTVWTSSSTNQVFDDNLEGAGRLTSHVSVNGQNLIFSENQCWTFQYIGLPLVWDITLKDAEIGIIAPMARCVANGVAFWMGQSNFYMWRGGDIEVIPANTQDESTILNYVFGNINWSQKSKAFAWHNKLYDEVWFHYPDADSNEPNRLARVNVKDFTWCPDEMDRTAAEYPTAQLQFPRMMNTNLLLQQEFGNDDNGVPLAWELVSKKMTSAKNTALWSGFIPDSNQTGDITLTIDAWRYPQSQTTTYSVPYTVSPQTELVNATTNGRFWQYTWAGEALNQEWTMGNWGEFVQPGAAN